MHASGHAILIGIRTVLLIKITEKLDNIWRNCSLSFNIRQLRNVTLEKKKIQNMIPKIDYHIFLFLFCFLTSYTFLLWTSVITHWREKIERLGCWNISNLYGSIWGKEREVWSGREGRSFCGYALQISGQELQCIYARLLTRNRAKITSFGAERSAARGQEGLGDLRLWF